MCCTLKYLQGPAQNFWAVQARVHSHRGEGRGYQHAGKPAKRHACKGRLISQTANCLQIHNYLTVQPEFIRLLKQAFYKNKIPKSDTCYKIWDLYCVHKNLKCN